MKSPCKGDISASAVTSTGIEFSLRAKTVHALPPGHGMFMWKWRCHAVPALGVLQAVLWASSMTSDDLDLTGESMQRRCGWARLTVVPKGGHVAGMWARDVSPDTVQHIPVSSNIAAASVRHASGSDPIWVQYSQMRWSMSACLMLLCQIMRTPSC